MSDGTAFVLDASALLALFHCEKGGDEIDRIISREDATVYMSAINYAEVLSKAVAHGKNPEIIIAAIRTLDIHVMAFDAALAELAGVLKPQAAPWGLSLGDCACLVLAKHLEATAVTADTAWANLGNAFRMMFIR